MLVRTHASAETLEAARAVGLTPGRLAARCVARALRGAALRAAFLFLPGALTPRDDVERTGAAAGPIAGAAGDVVAGRVARAGATSLFSSGALTPRLDTVAR